MPRRAAVPPAGHRPPRRMPLHRRVSPPKGTWVPEAGRQEQPLLPTELQDGGCRQRGGSRRHYAAVCRAGSSHLRLGHRPARRTGRRARWKRCRRRLCKTYGPFGGRQ
eukprot:scaffold27135_cov36-Phaeocystis_antarctica.AAC.1